MGRRLARHGRHPDLMLSSPARRALDTCRTLAGSLAYPCRDIRIEPQLYGTPVRGLLSVVHALPAHRRCVLLCGHNPELLALVRRFAPCIERLPTCGVAELRFRVRSWQELSRTSLVKVRLRCPRRHR